MFSSWFCDMGLKTKDCTNPGRWREVTRPTGLVQRCIMVRGDVTQGCKPGLENVL